MKGLKQTIFYLMFNKADLLF